MYDYKNPNDLVKWAKVQLNKKTKYVLGGIGRYQNGTRIFDCVGLIKCFLWHDYSSSNSSYYGKTAPDINADTMYAKAKTKGRISSIPETPGLLVYQKGHIGIYIGNGYVIESTSKKWNGKGAKVVKSQFKNSNGSMYRGTWTHWLKCPYLNYVAANTYVVKQGDNLSKIAKKYNTSVSKLVEVNNIADKDKIFIGQVIKLK